MDGWMDGWVRTTHTHQQAAARLRSDCLSQRQRRNTQRSRRCTLFLNQPRSSRNLVHGPSCRLGVSLSTHTPSAAIPLTHSLLACTLLAEAVCTTTSKPRRQLCHCQLSFRLILPLPAWPSSTRHQRGTPHTVAQQELLPVFAIPRHGAVRARSLLLLRELSQLLPRVAHPQGQQPELQDPPSSRRGTHALHPPRPEMNKDESANPRLHLDSRRAASRTSTSSKTPARTSCLRSRRSDAPLAPSRSSRPCTKSTPTGSLHTFPPSYQPSTMPSPPNGEPTSPQRPSTCCCPTTAAATSRT